MELHRIKTDSVAIRTDSLLMLNLNIHRLNLVIQMSLLVTINLITEVLTMITRTVKTDRLEKQTGPSQKLFYSISANESLQTVQEQPAIGLHVDVGGAFGVRPH